MPLEAIAINDLNAPLIKKPQTNDELKLRLQAMYDETAEFESGEHAIQCIQQVFKDGGCLYVGMFNDKPICAVSGMFDEGKGMSNLNYLTVHPQNKNRGIEADFLNKISRLQPQLISDDEKIQAFLKRL